MKLIVGLGNPGEKYAGTRHNFGFLAVDDLARRFGFSGFRFEKKFFGQISEGVIEGERVLILKPETFMNLSGKSVATTANFYKIPATEVWVFFDDLDLDFGVVRFRGSGSAGGHNGVRSVIAGLGTEDFPRVKFGISNDFRKKIPAEAFVLQRFSEEERAGIPEILERANKIFLKNCF